MQHLIIVNLKPLHGKRQKRMLQDGIAHEAAALTVPPDAAPQSQAGTRRKKPYGRAISAAILLFAPFLYPGVLLIIALLSGGGGLFILVAFIFLASALSSVGGLLLYLAARAMRYLRKTIGYVSLALVVLQVNFLILFLKDIQNLSFDTAAGYEVFAANFLIGLIVLIMIALCVLSVLLLSRLIKGKKRKPFEA